MVHVYKTKGVCGNPCGLKRTSCPDQLTYALEEAMSLAAAR